MVSQTTVNKLLVEFKRNFGHINYKTNHLFYYIKAVSPNTDSREARASFFYGNEFSLISLDVQSKK